MNIGARHSENSHFPAASMTTTIDAPCFVHLLSSVPSHSEGRQGNTLSDILIDLKFVYVLPYSDTRTKGREKN